MSCPVSCKSSCDDDAAAAAPDPDAPAKTASVRRGARARVTTVRFKHASLGLLTKHGAHPLMHSRRQVLSILYNSSFTHAAPVYLGLGDTSLKAATSGGSIKHRTHPLPYTFEERNTIDTGAATVFAHSLAHVLSKAKHSKAQNRRHKTLSGRFVFCLGRIATNASRMPSTPAAGN